MKATCTARLTLADTPRAPRRLPGRLGGAVRLKPHNRRYEAAVVRKRLRQVVSGALVLEVSGTATTCVMRLWLPWSRATDPRVAHSISPDTPIEA